MNFLSTMTLEQAAKNVVADVRYRRGFAVYYGGRGGQGKTSRLRLLVEAAKAAGYTELRCAHGIVLLKRPQS
jgi:hypothetical protein